MAGLKLFQKRGSSGKDKSITTLGDGFYMEYDHVLNGLGGYHPVNIVLKDSRKHAYQITNANGWFTDFPGTKEGEWEERLDARMLLPIVSYTFSVSSFVNGICYVSWMVQPDGRYFEDEYGFGAENFSEIELYSKMDTKGKFICPFQENLKNLIGGVDQNIQFHWLA